MENIYSWLYDTYFNPRAEDILAACEDLSPATEDAMRLLVTGGGSELDRKDAINLLIAQHGTAAFAAGVYFGCHLMTDMHLSDTARTVGTVVL